MLAANASVDGASAGQSSPASWSGPGEARHDDGFRPLGAAPHMPDHGHRRPHKTIPSTRELLSPVALIALLGLGVLAAVVLFSARTEDRLTADSSQHLVATNVDASLNELARINRDYAWSDDAVRQFSGKPDRDWIKENLGQKLFQIHDLAMAFVLDPDDHTVFATPIDRRKSNDAVAVLAGGLPNLLDETRLKSSFRPVTAAGLLMFRGTPALVAATVITPAVGSRFWLGPVPRYVLVFVRTVDRQYLEELASEVGISGIAFESADRPGGPATLDLQSPLGMSLGTLIWSPVLPGQSLVDRMMPIVSLTLGALAGLFFLFLGRARRIGAEVARQAIILDQIQDAVIAADLRGIITQWNGGAERMFGYTADEALGRSLAFIDPTNIYAANEARMLAMDVEEGHFEVEGVGKRKNGEIFPVHLSLSAASNRRGDRIGTVGYVLDITKRKQLETQLEELATVDALTGARNRHYFAEQVPAEIERARRFHHPLTFLFFDLDHFKRVNDRYGHKFGDTVLASMSALCRRILRKSDIFVRYGGEEFVAVLPETDLEGARRTAARISDQLRNTQFSVDPPVRLTVSIGISELRGPEDTLEALMQRIDKAVYRAKALGRDRIEVAV